MGAKTQIISQWSSIAHYVETAPVFIRGIPRLDPWMCSMAFSMHNLEFLHVCSEASPAFVTKPLEILGKPKKSLNPIWLTRKQGTNGQFHPYFASVHG